MPVNDKIRESDYNSIRNKVVNVLGVGSGNSGYGQNIRSAAVAEGFKVSRTDWGNLRWDIINAFTHIFGSAPTTVNPQEGNTIRYSNTFVPDTGASDAPVTQYDTHANTIIANRFTVHPSQSATVALATASTTWPGVYGNFWNSRIQCTVTASWTSAAQARYFFNSGGLIRFSSSRSGGSTNSQNTSWTSILSSAGTRSFGGNTPGTGVSPNDGTNYFRCTSSYQQWSINSGSTPYGSNSWRISARTPGVANNSSGTASVVEFLIEWIDNYTDPGTVQQPGESGPRNPADFPPDDAVDGTFSLSTSYLYSTGVLQPPLAGNFTIEQPSVTIGVIAP